MPSELMARLQIACHDVVERLAAIRAATSSTFNDTHTPSSPNPTMSARIGLR